jgi:anti-sigma regulatory factor (Ser/Thr protein kinase)
MTDPARGNLDPDASPVSLHVAIPRDPACASTARQIVRDALGGRLSDQGLEQALLATSELVTNAWKHGEGAIELKLACGAQTLRIEVIDEGSGAVSEIREQPADESGGWGLRIVDHVAAQWGCFEGTTHVWVELPLAEDAPEPRAHVGPG